MNTNLHPDQQRIAEEKAELDKNAAALSKFIGENQAFQTFDAADKELLKEVCETMWQRSETLAARIAAF